MNIMIWKTISQGILPNSRLVNRCVFFSRMKSSSPFNGAAIQATVSDDGRTIVCWHPENLTTIKYEHTKPLPVRQHDSVIKAEVHDQIEETIFKRDLHEEDLIRLTYRPRPLWRRNVRELKRHLYREGEPLNRIGI